MKRQIILFGFLFVISFFSFGQEKYATYDNTYLFKTFDIQIDFKEGDKFTIYLDAYSLDKLSDKGGFMINEKELEGFIANINQAKFKYDEWLKTAKENNVKELKKEMSIEAKKVGGFFHYGSKWNFDFYVQPTYKFVISEISEQIHYILYVNSGKLTASSNEYIDNDGFILTFTSVEEIDAFTSLLSLEKINAFRAKPKAEDLFKD